MQALLAVQVIPKCRKRFRIQGWERKPSVVCPAREAVDASQQGVDAIWVIPTRFQPVCESIKVGTCGAEAVVLLCWRPFEIGS